MAKRYEIRGLSVGYVQDGIFEVEWQRDAMSFRTLFRRAPDGLLSFLTIVERWNAKRRHQLFDPSSMRAEIGAVTAAIEADGLLLVQAIAQAEQRAAEREREASARGATERQRAAGPALASALFFLLDRLDREVPQSGIWAEVLSARVALELAGVK